MNKTDYSSLSLRDLKSDINPLGANRTGTSWRGERSAGNTLFLRVPLCMSREINEPSLVLSGPEPATIF
jgi:hypothetical protein